MTPLPPYAALLRLRPSGEPGVLVMPWGDAVLGRPGFVHGGAIAGLLEIAAFHALELALEADETAAPTQAKPIGVTVDFLRGATACDTLAAGTVKRLGRRVAHVEARAWQDDPDRPVAAARMNLLLVRA